MTSITETLDTLPVEAVAPKTPFWKKALKVSFIASSGAFIGFHAAMTVVLASAATAAHYGVMDKIDLLHPLFGA